MLKKISNPASWFPRKTVNIKSEQKSFQNYLFGAGNIFDPMMLSQNTLITKTLAVNYYTKCQPIFHAITLIANEIANLVPNVWDLKKEIWVPEHPILEFIESPNADITWHEFVFAFVSYYLATGDSYIVATGKPMTEPKEMFVYPSPAVAIVPGNDGFAQKIQTTMYWGSDIFFREEIKKRFRFFNASKTSEIWQMKFFNPTLMNTNVYGMSPLNAIFYEINQHQGANAYNLSVLLRGASPSGVVSIDPPTDHATFKQIEKDFEMSHAGASNAGRLLLLNGIGKYQQTSMTHKDMDFLELKRDVVLSMYKTLNIPLALVNTETMTLDNMTRAMLMFYDFAVIPLANRIFKELNNFLMPRFGADRTLQFTFDQGEILALEPRRNEQMKLLKDLGIFTVNQLRKFVGAEPLLGGNAVYATMSTTPQMIDPNDTNVLTKYEDMPALDDVGGRDDNRTKRKKRERLTQEQFAEALRSKVDEAGATLFSEDEIAELMKEHGF